MAFPDSAQRAKMRKKMRKVWGKALSGIARGGWGPQWRSQGLPGWAVRPPGRPKWGRKLRKFEEKWEKSLEERLRKCSYLAHPGIMRGWLRPWGADAPWQKLCPPSLPMKLHFVLRSVESRHFESPSAPRLPWAPLAAPHFEKSGYAPEEK